MQSLISKDGPFTRAPTGKFKRDGETPIMRKCKPYWVVRYWTGDTSFQDRHFSDEAAADAFIATLSITLDTGARGRVGGFPAERAHA